MKKYDLMAVDTETTSTDPNLARIMQIGVSFRESAKTEINTLTTYIKPEYDAMMVQPNVLGVTGISPAFLYANGYDLRETMEEYMVLLNSANYLVIHKADYDVPVITREFAECGLNFPVHIPIIDTLRLVKEFCPIADWQPDSIALPDHKLPTCYYGLVTESRTNTAPTRAHDAGGDTEMTLLLTEWFCKHLGKTLAELAEICSAPFVPKVMPFGKHKNMPFDELPVDYMRWLIEKSDALENDAGLAQAVITEFEKRQSRN